MTGRRHATKTRFALWTLIVVADLVLIVVTVGMLTVLLAVAGAVAVAATVVGLWRLGHRPRPAGIPKIPRLRRRG
jgi:sugar phosphate permease